MKYNTVIFDMDGLLIDSEPLWEEAADELLNGYGFSLSKKQYSLTTGLRTKEFLEHWFKHFNIPDAEITNAEKKIVTKVITLVKSKGKAMPGVDYIFNYFLDKNFKIGLATSSPPQLIDAVIDLLGIRQYLDVISSASELAYGKPHPEVYIVCAEKAGVQSLECICFEDSFNGMIAAKAAKMKCIVVPSPADFKRPVWEAADLKISTLQNFNDLLLVGL